jgi:hypothetical protein
VYIPTDWCAYSEHIAGAYFHESFVKEDRKLSLEITRIKAPKRRRTGKGNEKEAKKCEDKRSKEQVSPLAKFIPQSQDKLGSRSMENNGMGNAQPRAYFHNQACQHSQYNGKPSPPNTSASTPGQDIGPPSVAETYEWLINAGVPFSAFDPIAIESQRPRPSSKDGIGSDLFECADEIKSLFSAPSSPVSSPQWSSSDVVPRKDVIVSIQPAANASIHFNDGILDDLAPLDLQWGIQAGFRVRLL